VGARRGRLTLESHLDEIGWGRERGAARCRARRSRGENGERVERRRRVDLAALAQGIEQLLDGDRELAVSAKRLPMAAERRMRMKPHLLARALELEAVMALVIFEVIEETPPDPRAASSGSCGCR